MKITSFKQIKEIIAPIAPEKFNTENYYKGDEKNPISCCFLGHIHMAVSGNPMGDYHGFGARELTIQMIKEMHGLDDTSGAEVNNFPNINGYTEPVIKDRLMHMIEDGIKWEASKTA